MQLAVCPRQACNGCYVILEIDIWRAATLMLKRYGDKALERAVLGLSGPGKTKPDQSVTRTG
jgi:hypothetical protein